MYLRIVCIWITLACACNGQSDKAKSLYAKGVQENQAGNLIEASVFLTDALAEEPRYADAYYQRGMSYFGIKKLDAAIADLDQATLLRVKSINAYLILIDLYKAQNSFKKALDITSRIANNLPKNAVGAYYAQGLIYEELTEYSNALKAYRIADRLAYKLKPELMRPLQKRIAEVLMKAKKAEVRR